MGLRNRAFYGLSDLQATGLVVTGALQIQRTRL
jgi:hypothetical protein